MRTSLADTSGWRGPVRGKALAIKPETLAVLCLHPEIIAGRLFHAATIPWRCVRALRHGRPRTAPAASEKRAGGPSGTEAITEWISSGFSNRRNGRSGGSVFLRSTPPDAVDCRGPAPAPPRPGPRGYACPEARNAAPAPRRTGPKAGRAGNRPASGHSHPSSKLASAAWVFSAKEASSRIRSKPKPGSSGSASASSRWLRSLSITVGSRSGAPVLTAMRATLPSARKKTASRMRRPLPSRSRISLNETASVCRLWVITASVDHRLGKAVLGAEIGQRPARRSWAFLPPPAG